MSRAACLIIDGGGGHPCRPVSQCFQPGGQEGQALVSAVPAEPNRRVYNSVRVARCHPNRKEEISSATDPDFRLTPSHAVQDWRYAGNLETRLAACGI